MIGLTQHHGCEFPRNIPRLRPMREGTARGAEPGRDEPERGPRAREAYVMTRIAVPDAPSVVAGHGRAAIFTPDGELLLLSAPEAVACLHGLPPPLLVHAPASFRRL